MKKLKVIFLPWLLVISLFAGSCLPVCAADSQTIILPGDFESLGYDCIILSNGYYYLCTTSVPCFYDKENDYSTNNRLVFDDEAVGVEYSSNSLDFTGASSYSMSSKPYYSSNVYTGIYSTYDIYYKDSDEIFFQLPLPPLSRIVAGMKAELMGTVVLREILTMIPLLIPLLAGYLGLRKALREVSRILRTA